jgi:hypothetical protein
MEEKMPNARPNPRQSVGNEGKGQNVPGNGLNNTKLGESTSTSDQRQNQDKPLYPNS